LSLGAICCKSLAIFLSKTLIIFRRTTTDGIAIFVQTVLSCFFDLGLVLFAGCVTIRHYPSRTVKERQGTSKDIITISVNSKSGVLHRFLEEQQLKLPFLDRLFWGDFLIWGLNWLQVGAFLDII
jgi:hypothetical protein